MHKTLRLFIFLDFMKLIPGEIFSFLSVFYTIQVTHRFCRRAVTQP